MASVASVASVASAASADQQSQRLGEVADLADREARRYRAVPVGAGRHHGMGEAEPVCLLDALVDAGHWTDFARQANLAEGYQSLGSGFRALAEATASATARSVAGSLSLTPPTVAT